MKRLAVFLDGTWNEPGDNTNVWRLRSMLSRVDPDGVVQLSYYDEGVGTRWNDRLRGGWVGQGLSDNVRQAYQWLMEHYDEGDEIYLFGFSRGAFTARSLAGMLSKCGLLRPGAPMPVHQLFDRYNSKARPIHQLPNSSEGRDDLSLEDIWIVEYSRRTRVTFIGVWDTVSALGARLWRRGIEARGEHDAHFVRLSSSFDHAVQALAIDEHRKPYLPALWYRYLPQAKPDLAHEPPPVVEQRWFAGAHSQVGGGYRGDELAQLPLGWIQKKAVGVGLHFRYDVPLTGREHTAPLIDSFADFMKGAYRVLRFGRRTRRPIGRERDSVEGGWVEPVTETIDGSVFERWRADPTYRPDNLADWADRRGVDISTLRGAHSVSGAPGTEEDR